MNKASGQMRISRVGWIVIGFVILVAAAFGAWRMAIATNSVGLLDWGDRQFGGNSGYRLALIDGRYGTLPANKIEVLVPAEPAAQPRPLLVFFHGGGWNSGDPGDYRFVGRQFARAGYVVFLPGYRLGPEGRYPHMLEDSATAVAWIRDHAARFGGDPDRLFLMGHSAGAYNAVMLGLERQWLGRSGIPDGYVKGVIGLSGPYDFFPFTSDSARNAFGHIAEPAITQPIRHVRADGPPMLLVSGDADETVKPRNAIALGKALGTSPVLLAGVDHAGTVMKLAAPFNRDRRVLDPVLAFLAAHGGASAPVQE